MQKFLTRQVVHNDGMMRSCTDGNYYRKEVSLSSNIGNDAHKIGIILNLDDVCLVNSLGVRAKTYKYCMIYYTMAEIPQGYRSKLLSIFLLACVKINHVKKYGLRWILVDFIMGMKQLENPGIYINNFGMVNSSLANGNKSPSCKICQMHTQSSQLACPTRHVTKTPYGQKTTQKIIA